MIPGITASRRRGGGPTLWTPANLAVPPMIWVDWDSAVTDVSGRASAWSNSKGSLGGSFTEATNRPQILASELSGKRALRFDGVNDRLASSAAAAFARNSSQSVVVAIIRPRTKAGAGCVMAVNASGGGARARINCGYGYPASTGMYGASSRRDATDSEAVVSATVSAAAWSVVAWRYGFSANDMAIRVNGNASAITTPAWGSGATTSNTASGYAAMIGVYPTGANFADMDLAALICVDGAISSDDIERLEGWSAWQTGLESNLPSGHPYESAPPYV